MRIMANLKLKLYDFKKVILQSTRSLFPSTAARLVQKAHLLSQTRCIPSKTVSTVFLGFTATFLLYISFVILWTGSCRMEHEVI
jgi:hypothetical protein